MATCKKCTVFLLSTDEHYWEDFTTYIQEVFESPAPCPGCRTLLKGVTLFVPELEDLARKQTHGFRLQFARYHGPSILAYIDRIGHDGYTFQKWFEFYTLPSKSVKSLQPSFSTGAVA
jgi:hypothetical protein